MKKTILSIMAATAIFSFNADAAAAEKEGGLDEHLRPSVRQIVREKMIKREWTVTYEDWDRLTNAVMATGDWHNVRKSVQMVMVEEAEKRRGGSSGAVASYEESERANREEEVLERRRAEDATAAEARLAERAEEVRAELEERFAQEEAAAARIQAGARGMQGRRHAAARAAEVRAELEERFAQEEAEAARVAVAAVSAEHAARIPGLLEAAEILKDQILEQAAVRSDLDRVNELLAELRGITDTVEELRTHLTDADYDANAGDLTIIYDLYADAETAIARQS